MVGRIPFDNEPISARSGGRLRNRSLDQADFPGRAIIADGLRGVQHTETRKPKEPIRPNELPAGGSFGGGWSIKVCKIAHFPEPNLDATVSVLVKCL